MNQQGRCQQGPLNLSRSFFCSLFTTKFAGCLPQDSFKAILSSSERSYSGASPATLLTIFGRLLESLRPPTRRMDYGI
jgi:hypothetical protein